MKYKQKLIGISLILTAMILSACGSQTNTNNSSNESGMMGGGMMGGGMMGNGNGGMMRFHMATIPAEYEGLNNPINSDEESILRGQITFTTYCAVCHGDGGMGDGPAGEALDPSPAAIAHTSQMMSDEYLYWRISEGGAEFETGMLPFKDVLTSEDRWDVINYVRALGSNEVAPQNQFGGNVNNPEAQATQQTEMLAEAVSQEVISQEEADLFAELHPTIDEYIENNRDELSKTNQTMMESGLSTMVEIGLLTEEQANQFSRIHDLLMESGLMQ